MTTSLIIVPLGKAHDRSGFRCGNDRIDRYFREAVSQDVRRNDAACLVAIEPTTNRIAGFYTLSSSSVPLTDVPPDLARKLPRYPSVPAVLIGWLARHSDFAGAGVGELLLFDAIRTVSEASIGAHAVLADAIDEHAAAFYTSYGFSPLSSRERTRYFPVAAARVLLGE